MSEEATYEVGKGKPPLNRRFGQPEGNPNGKTAEQKRLEMLNAESAMRIRARMLEAVERKLLADDVTQEQADTAALDMVEVAMLKLIKDSENRGLGAPVQALTGPEGGPLQIILKRYADDAPG